MQERGEVGSEMEAGLEAASGEDPEERETVEEGWGVEAAGKEA